MDYRYHGFHRVAIHIERVSPVVIALLKAI
jgi:hypothetical protein